MARKRLLEPLVIEEDAQEPIKCFGYCRSSVQVVITYLLCVLTLGLLLLVFYWKPNWRLKMMHKRCGLHKADAVLIKDAYHREHVKYMNRMEVNEKSVVTANHLSNILKKDAVVDGYLKYFSYQKMKYIWDVEHDTFFVLRAPELNTPTRKFFEELQCGLSKKDVEIRQEIFGLNKITITVKPILVMLVQEVLNPFYVFQIYSCAIWFAVEYWTFTIIILLLSAISISMSLYVTRKHSVTLRKMAESFLKVEVLRPDGSTVVQMESELVPGDVILIPPQGCTMTCDAVLINGTCIVNESMLTGESVPVTKVSLSSQQSAGDQNDIYSPESHKRHTLFCGTRVIQTRQSGKDAVKAVVVQTGFSTFKGTLVRTILYPRPMEFKLYRDAMMFVGFYVALAVVGIIYSATVLTTLGNDPKKIVLLTLDTATIAIQPLLPVALTVGMLYAQIRLKKRGIFCINPQRINLSGIVDVVCFDKTGTLTEDGLDMLGVRRMDGDTLLSMESKATSLPECPFLHTMFTCHSLAIIEGKLQGDPMDLKMFEATEWIFEEKEENVNASKEETRQVTIVKPPINSDQHASPFVILKQFTFSSSLQRMSVVAQNQSSRELAGFVKGSPEMIYKLCDSSTVPSNFSEVLESYTGDGFRVIALAWKPLECVDGDSDGLGFKRDDIESDLTFLGFLVWQNPLKPESLPVITELQKANIRTIMITGDNILTAINVAGKCGMVSPEDTMVQVTTSTAECTKGKDVELDYKTIVRNFCNNNVEMNTEEDGFQESMVLTTQSGGENFALDGKTFAAIQEQFPQAFQEILLRGTVFARMAPNQKQELVEALQELEYTVGMCGDGANDCGALKTAHAGISLSDAEASVASPFTSKIANISCVPMVIKEGRSALVTSFGLFKYIAMYTFIMYVTTNITKKFGAYPSNSMFTFWEVAIVTPVVLLMGRSGPYDQISEKKPPTRLVSLPTLCSVVYHVFILILCQAAATLMVESQSWYTEFVPDPGNYNAPSWEACVTFLVSNVQYVLYGIVFAPGPPYQASIKKNPFFLVHLILLTLLCSIVILAPLEKLDSAVWGMNYIPEFKFRMMIFLLCVANVVASFVMEYFVFPRESVQKVLRCLKNESIPKYKELKIDMQINAKEPNDSAV